LPKFPEIFVEIINDNGVTDIVADRFDMDMRVSMTINILTEVSAMTLPIKRGYASAH
jgi:hypothetical protein